MNLSYLIKDYTSYNLWANQKIVGWLQTKPTYTMEQEVPSSFPNLKQTLFHIWYSQDIWLARLKQVAAKFTYGQLFHDKLETLFEGILKQSEEFNNYIHKLSEIALEQNYQFTIPYVGTFNGTAAEMMQHCINHSTYHRGQIITIARNVGLTDPPMTDYIYYLMQKNK